MKPFEESAFSFSALFAVCSRQIHAANYIACANKTYPFNHVPSIIYGSREWMFRRQPIIYSHNHCIEITYKVTSVGDIAVKTSQAKATTMNKNN